METTDILKSAAKAAADARHNVHLELRTYGVLVRVRGEDPEGNVFQIGNGVTWEQLEVCGILERQIEICLMSVDQAIIHGDQKLTATP